MKQPVQSAARAIDVHTHVVPQEFPRYLGTAVDVSWPSMAPAHACHRHVMVSGKVYRTVSHQCWDCAVRQKDMLGLGTGRQVLSPMPELLSYWFSPRDGAAICRFLNETIAAMVAEAPSAFVGLAAVPLQDVSLAIAELDHAIHKLGLRGVEIGGNINDDVIGHPKFLPFFEAAATWGAAVFVHPLRPAGMNRLVGAPALEQALAFPGETGLAAASMITGGTLARLPALRIAYSHGGGSFQALLPRLQHAWKQLPGLGEQFIEPVKAARSMYYDSLVYDASTIRHLVDVFGAKQVMVGTDYPFSIMENEPIARLESTGLAPDVIALVRSVNAARWLGLPVAES
ncbi:MAG: amidohydrolase family protein [Burkholderiaceae bacterium]